MRYQAILTSAVAICAAASSISAQAPRITRIGPGEIFPPMGAAGFLESQPRAVIGVGTTSAATSRDTLGVLVSTVRAGSPAEKAGIEEGNRIASINGVSLKLSAADIGDEQMANVLSRRLNRELDKLRPGDEVDLRVYASGQTKSVKVKTVAPDDLYATSSSSISRGRNDDRATLGINIGVTGTSRDSLGIFVMGVEDGSAAAKAGIEEGSRIVSINGVDLRGTKERDRNDDFFYQPTNLNRLEREMARVKPGDDVDLRVYYNNQFKNVKVKAGRASDLPRRKGSVTIMKSGDDAMLYPRVETKIDPGQFGDDFRKTLEKLRVNIGRSGNRVEW
jgi:C-terminal processing protease CtpA/Prc